MRSSIVFIMPVSMQCLHYCLQKGSPRRNMVASGALLHQNFIKPGLVGSELGQIYDRLFDNRQKSDYADLVRFNPDEVRGWHEEARNFVETIQDILNRDLQGE